MVEGLHRGRDEATELRKEVDVVVVGTGAGGSMVLRELARAGLRVLGLEEGAASASLDFNQREEQMFSLLYKDGGGQQTADLAIRVLQGRGLGGSTVHNTNLCKRTPDAILDLWSRKYRVSGVTPQAMASHFERVEQDLSITEIPDSMRNRNNEILRRGVEALGWKGGPLKHNRVGCMQSGFCELGCAYDAKQNALKVLLPEAFRAGAEVYTDVEVRRVLWAKGRVEGVEAVVKDGDGKPRTTMHVRAKAVVLAASAVGSAALVRASSLPDPHKRAGRGLRMHPGAVAAGVFDEPVFGHKGIPQSYECTEHLSFEEGSPRRIWIVPAFAHPIGTASSLPGFGAAHLSKMRKYTQFAVLTAMLHDESEGEVRVGRDGRAVLDYELNPTDRRCLAEGLLACAKILFAAGAREVMIPGIPPLRFTTPGAILRVAPTFVAPHAVPMTAVHPMGTLAMGDDPNTSVVSSQGMHHQVQGLFAADGSLFPTSLGGPPQVSIYAFAHRGASFIVDYMRKAG